MISANAQLSAAVEELYRQFATSLPQAPLNACPCCISPAENAVLSAVPLRQLTADQLARYAFKALTTWGDAADFRHFLPRILELKASGELFTDFPVLRGKLEQAGYSAWPEPEQAAVRAVLLAGLGRQWQQHSIDLAELGPALDLVGGIGPVLAQWQVSEEGMVFENLAYLAAHELSTLNEHRASWVAQGFTPTVVAELNQWFRRQVPVLEAGFFRWADEQPALAELASWGHDYVSRLPAR
ncbi:hypothetical protein [Hymenobacter sp. B81]|uniref:hypothetical protein n=1 Tax=Hymenobacter sp. B81 TaxID=3344878 RepID=UPI0037DC87FC